MERRQGRGIDLSGGANVRYFLRNLWSREEGRDIRRIRRDARRYSGIGGFYDPTGWDERE